MARVINAQALQATVAVSVILAGAWGIKSTYKAWSERMEARDTGRLAQVIGFVNLAYSPEKNASEITEKFARQMAATVFPQITPHHLRPSFQSGTTFFVKSPDGFNDAVPVILSYARTHFGGTYVRVQDGLTTTNYNCKMSHALHVDAGIGSARNKGHIGNLFSNCTDINSPQHITSSENRTGTVSGIPQPLRDDVVRNLTTDELFTPGTVKTNTVTLRRADAAEYVTATRPYAYINGKPIECQLALKANSLSVNGGYVYSDRTDRNPPEPVVTVYHCTAG